MKYLKTFKIFETSEFVIQRFDTSQNLASTNTPYDPQLSMDSYDQHYSSIKSSMVRLSNILNGLIGSGQIYSFGTDRIIDGQDIKNIFIQRLLNENGDYTIYITFEINEKEYYGVIKNFIQNPTLSSECFRDPDLLVNKEWVIRTKGLLIKTIKLWLVPESGGYKSLKDIYCTGRWDGKLYVINTNQKINVIKSFDDKIIITTKGTECILDGDNYFYFNWWFEKEEK